MKLADFFNYENEMFSPLREAARNVTAAMQNANRGLDTLKEIVLIDIGLVHTSDAIHELAHKQPQRFDVIGDILHQRHLIQEYPATEEYTKHPEDLDGVFEEVIQFLRKNDEALKEFIRVCDETQNYALARQAETLQIENSEDCEKFLLAWNMFDTTDASATSFDDWVLHLFHGGDK